MKKIILASILLTSIAAQAMEIVEKNKLTLGDVSALIKNPVHYGSNLPFSALFQDASSLNGVCRSLGYEKAADRSAHDSGSMIKMADTIKVDENGSVVGGPKAYFITDIVCLNKTKVYPNEQSIILTNPKHLESGLSYTISSSNGICRNEGYLRAVSDSVRTSDTYADSIEVDSSGSVVGVQNNKFVTQIVCITNRYPIDLN